MFEDLFSSLGAMFGGGGDSGGGIEASPNTPQAGTVFAPTEGKGGGGDLLTSLILGVGGPLISKLMGGGNDSMMNGALSNLQKSSNVGTNTGLKLIRRAGAGKLTDPQQAQVDSMKAEQNARWGQYLASLGIPVSTAMVQGQNEVDLKAQKLASDLINQSFDQGIKALGLGGTASTQLIANAMAQKQDLAKTIQDVAKQIGMVLNTPQQQAPGTGGGTPMLGGIRVPAEWGNMEADPQYSYMDPFGE